eukprot:symbB.v1.2.012360.t1/scaffold854.1/size229663/14
MRVPPSSRARTEAPTSPQATTKRLELQVPGVQLQISTCIIQSKGPSLKSLKRCHPRKPKQLPTPRACRQESWLPSSQEGYSRLLFWALLAHIGSERSSSHQSR